MENNSQSRPQLVKTPVLDIPLGEPIVSDDGYHYGLKIKKPKENGGHSGPTERVSSDPV